MSKYKIGFISANIAGDHRYTDTCRVYHDIEANTVTVEVFSTHAAGGMDGPGGTAQPDAPCFTKTVPADPKAVLALVKAVMSDGSYNFKQYGKPTKRFEWVTCIGRKNGLSLNLVALALSK